MMVSSHVVLVKGGAKNFDSIKEEIEKKLQISTSANVFASGNKITVNKNTTWTKISATITINRGDTDVEIRYNRESNATFVNLFLYAVTGSLALVVAQTGLKSSEYSWLVFGPVLPWYLSKRDMNKIDDAVESLLNSISNKQIAPQIGVSKTAVFKHL